MCVCVVQLRVIVNIAGRTIWLQLHVADAMIENQQKIQALFDAGFVPLLLQATRQPCVSLRVCHN